jgi:hypothetical protein
VSKDEVHGLKNEETLTLSMNEGSSFIRFCCISIRVGAVVQISTTMLRSI